MKTRIKRIAYITGILLVGGLIGYLIGTSSDGPADKEVKESKDEVWTCSMHPQVRKNEPGQCPICGMDLIPVGSEDNSQQYPLSITMSPTAMQLASVSTAVVGSGGPSKSIRLNGKVQADERLVFSQSSHWPGRIERLMVNFTGEFVKKGQVIATVYSPDLVTAQEELFEAVKVKKSQPQLFNAAKEKLKNWKLSERQIEQILQRGTVKEEFAVQADVSGIVTKKPVNKGDYIRKGEAIYEIADLSTVWILFDVYESDIAWVKKGDEVNFTIASYPGDNFKGKISYVDPVIDPKTRVAKARLEAPNKGLKLKPEMFVSGTVSAQIQNESTSISIPKTAVMWTGKRSVVYVKNVSEQGVHFTMREVTLGPSLGESFIIESGLNEGEEIAVNGTFSIDAAAQLAGKPSMMNPEGNAVSTGHNHGMKTMPNPSDASISKKAKDALYPLFSEYLSLKDALVAGEYEKSVRIAGTLRTMLKKVNMSLFTGESHKIYMVYRSEIEKALDRMVQSEHIGAVRKEFKGVSVQFVHMARTFGPVNGTLYIQRCPMAVENKAADWISDKKEIRNPYLGEDMLTCGEVTEEIR